MASFLFKRSHPTMHQSQPRFDVERVDNVQKCRRCSKFSLVLKSMLTLSKKFFSKRGFPFDNVDIYSFVDVVEPRFDICRRCSALSIKEREI